MSARRFTDKPDLISRDEARRSGLRRYFTGKSCRRGHVAERLTAWGQCVECLKITSGKYRKKNSEDVGAAKRAYYLKNRDELLAYCSKWRAENSETLRKSKQQYHLQNREKIVARVNTWREKNPGKFRDAVVVSSANRRARKRGNGGTHTRADIQEIVAAQGNRCAYCRVSLSKKKRHIDHIMPISRGGSNFRSNLQALCSDCNLSKHAKDPIDFAQSLGRLL